MSDKPTEKATDKPADTKPEVTPAARLLLYKPGEVIPIKALHIDSQRNQVGIPGKTMGATVVFDPKAPSNRDRWTVYFIPHLRHHVVTFYKGDGSYTRAVMVHESMVTQAEPLLP
jgi:hypothetical protein